MRPALAGFVGVQIALGATHRGILAMVLAQEALGPVVVAGGVSTWRAGMESEIGVTRDLSLSTPKHRLKYAFGWPQIVEEECRVAAPDALPAREAEDGLTPESLENV